MRNKANRGSRGRLYCARKGIKGRNALRCHYKRGQRCETKPICGGGRWAQPTLQNCETKPICGDGRWAQITRRNCETKPTSQAGRRRLGHAAGSVVSHITTITSPDRVESSEKAGNAARIRHRMPTAPLPTSPCEAGNFLDNQASPGYSDNHSMVDALRELQIAPQPGTNVAGSGAESKDSTRESLGYRGTCRETSQVWRVELRETTGWESTHGR